MKLTLKNLSTVAKTVSEIAFLVGNLSINYTQELEWSLTTYNNLKKTIIEEVLYF